MDVLFDGPAWLDEIRLFSWLGRSPLGLGPAAQYLLHGIWPTPQMDDLWQQGQIPYSTWPGFPQPGFPTPYDPWGAAELTPEQELNILKAEAEQLEDELAGIEKRIKELEGENR